MTRNAVPGEIRFALHDNLFAYAWALDRADADGVAATFTSHGSVTGVAGQSWSGTEGIREFARQAFLQPSFNGRQHHIQPLFIEPNADGTYSMTSYWMAVTWDAGRAPVILSMGWYQDTCAEENGAWLFKAKIITHWNGEKAPMAGKDYLPS